jgi:hypothetical protein
MKKHEQKGNPETEKNPKPSNKADVLYQKLGNTWYAFSSINGDMYFGKVPDDVADAEADDLADFELSELDLLEFEEEVLEALDNDEIAIPKKLVI